MDVISGWHAANSILKKSFEEKNYVTLFKLNCLVYLIYSEYLYLHGEELFSEMFEKTKLGPAVPSIFFKFNSFRNNEITRYAKDAMGKTIGISSDLFDECLYHVWGKFKNMDSYEILSYIENGSCYSNKNYGEILSNSDMLMDEINRREVELENAKSGIKKLTPPKYTGNK